jgi:hypothetical protein
LLSAGGTDFSMDNNTSLGSRLCHPYKPKPMIYTGFIPMCTLQRELPAVLCRGAYLERRPLFYLADNFHNLLTEEISNIPKARILC